ncbi:hypothetical protein D3C76_597750 [compost metagenome]
MVRVFGGQAVVGEVDAHQCRQAVQLDFLPRLRRIAGPRAADLAARLKAELVRHTRPIQCHEAAAGIGDRVMLGGLQADQRAEQLGAQHMHLVDRLLTTLVAGLHHQHHVEAVRKALHHLVLRLVLAYIVAAVNDVGRRGFQLGRGHHHVDVNAARHPPTEGRAEGFQVFDQRGQAHDQPPIARVKAALRMRCTSSRVSSRASAM